MLREIFGEKLLEIDKISRTVGFGRTAENDEKELKNVKDYKEIDEMVDIAHSSTDVVGSRIMGGGFGGCTISVVKKSAVEDFKQMMDEQYYKKYNTPSVIYDIVVSDGTNEIML